MVSKTCTFVLSAPSLLTKNFHVCIANNLRIFGLIGESRQQHEPLALDLRGYIVYLGGHCRLRLIKKQTPNIILLQTQDLSYLKKPNFFVPCFFKLLKS